MKERKIQACSKRQYRELTPEQVHKCTTSARKSQMQEWEYICP
jgi:hypothetical protein